jgi:hypothetical protein
LNKIQLVWWGGNWAILSHRVVSRDVMWYDSRGGRGWNWTTFNLIHPGFRFLPSNQLTFIQFLVSFIFTKTDCWQSIPMWQISWKYIRIKKLWTVRSYQNMTQNIAWQKTQSIDTLDFAQMFQKHILLTRIVWDNHLWAST